MCLTGSRLISRLHLDEGLAVILDVGADRIGGTADGVAVVPVARLQLQRFNVSALVTAGRCEITVTLATL